MKDLNEIFGVCDPVFKKLVTGILKKVEIGDSKDVWEITSNAFSNSYYLDNENECWAILKHYQKPVDIDWDEAEGMLFKDCMKWVRMQLERKNES